MGCFNSHLLFFIFILLHSSALHAQIQTENLLSVNSGFYETPFLLKIIPKEGIELHFSTDGSVPTIKDPIFPPGIIISETTVLRLFVNDLNLKRDTILTFTYFINFKTKLPVVSLVTDSLNLWDRDTGITMLGPVARLDTSNGFWYNTNFLKKWERETNFEFFEENGICVVNQLCGIRVFGGVSRQLKEKSFRIIAREEYGKKRFKHQFFEKKDIKKFKSLVLRNGSGDSRKSRFKDELVTDLCSSLDLDYQASRPCILFINGVYRGIYNLREKIDEHFIASNRKIAKESIDLLQGGRTVEHGSGKSYNILKNFITNNDCSDKSIYDSICKLMDIRNFINYSCVQIYISNVDSRGNIRFWQSPDFDCKFRWILYDTDLGFGSSLSPSHNYLADCLSPEETNWYNPTWSTIMLRKLMTNVEFRNEFITQFDHIMNTTLHPDSLIEKVNDFCKIYEEEITRFYKFKGWNISQWRKEVTLLMYFSERREVFASEQLSQYFKLKGKVKIKLEVEPEGCGMITLNDNKIIQSKFSGFYYNDIPVKLKAIPNSDKYVFLHWKEDSNLNDEILVVPDKKDINYTAIFKLKYPEETVLEKTKISDNNIQYKYFFSILLLIPVLIIVLRRKKNE